MIGIILFIVSEVFAFLSVFWAFFHSSLSPAIEIGGSWPPLGITPLDPFAIPLLNTFLLLSSGAFVTYGHHALIAGNRKGAIDGVFLTIILAILFTALQYFEYSEAGFTMSDGVYGSAFYASTGLHGLITIVPIMSNKNLLNYKLTKHKKIKYSTTTLFEEKNKSLKLKKGKESALFDCEDFEDFEEIIYLDSEFLNWFSGFTDAEGNFNITLRKLNNNDYTSVMLTFQISLHIDDLFILKFIKEKLNCGHISISGSKCNFFVNDKNSLIQIILPIFNFVKLNSSKYNQFIVFEKAVNLIKDKKHLLPKGKLEMINLQKEIRSKNSSSAPSAESLNNDPLSLNWLGGFTDGDGCFSILINKPRLKYENHIKEFELFKRIQEFLDPTSNLIITKPRENRAKASITVCLDITNIHILKNKILPFFSKKGILKSKKLKDFKDWSILIDIYYFGYHLLPEGKILIDDIKKG